MHIAGIDVDPAAAIKLSGFLYSNLPIETQPSSNKTMSKSDMAPDKRSGRYQAAPDVERPLFSHEDERRPEIGVAVARVIWRLVFGDNPESSFIAISCSIVIHK